MDKLKLLSITLFGIFCSVEGQSFKIWTKFMDGNLIFTWNNTSTERNDIEITKDSSKPHWISVNDDQYTVEDIALYKIVRIRVREYKNRQFTDFTDHIVTFNVNTVESRVGESKNISWTIQKFPRSGDYFIFHAYIGRPRKIITVAQSVPWNSKKYFYLIKPYDSEKILFTIKNITVNDAGFYGGSDVETDAFLGEKGVILIVYGKPLKPTIRANLQITEKNYTSLKCESRSTSAPHYYKKFPPLSYSWFVNKTELDGENDETYSFVVSKDVIDNRYSCQAKETLKSDKSEEIQINPFFNTIESTEGESKNISWTAEYFPKGGYYSIFHNGSKPPIIQIQNIAPLPTKKYVYHTQPFNSVNILLEVRNITVGDAGYYEGCPTFEDALSGKSGVILTVFGKPKQPIIRGDRNVSVRYFTYLKCETRSTSAPEYYLGFPPLSYSWFVNGTKLEKETSELYRFKVSKDDKYNNYSCQANETLESVRSENFKINTLYGPDIVKITSLQHTNEIKEERRLTIKEGDSFGQFKCLADCNPPCTLQWKYKTITKLFVNATDTNISSITLPQQTANRTSMTQIQCIAYNTEGHYERSIRLNIEYLMKPIIRLNGRSDNPLYIKEGEILNISCFVDGNPNPSIDLIRSLEGQILGQQNKNWLYYIKRNAQCSDVDIYTCTGKSQLGNKSTDFTLNVQCKPRLDVSWPLKTIYGSMSGRNVKVLVAVPVIANPFPSTYQTGISWDGPGHPNIINNTIAKRDNFVYKHWINSTIPISNQRFFGNYTLYYNGEPIVIITIKAEDLPKPPLNFTWNSDARGYVNLTWISNFNGGPEQFFILSQMKESGWTFVENLTDPGEGNLGYYDLGPLTPGLEYLYQLESCNRINCSLSPREVKIKVKAPPILSFSLFGDNTMLILVGASAAGFVFVVVLTLAVTMHCKTTQKSAPKKRNREETLSGSTVQDDSPADAVVYAAVDKSVLMKNRQKDDVVKSDVIKDQNDDNDTMYSEVIKHPKKQQTDEKKEKKKNKEKELQGMSEEAGASTSNDNSRSTNQDGLVYIDVEFARKPPSSDTKGRPVIHGEEEKTEYTFVDFSQKAPPVQETQENVK